MAPSILPALLAVLITLSYPTAAHSPKPWPMCDALYNYYHCRGHPEGGIICQGTVKRGSTEPLAVLWTRDIEGGNEKDVPGQDDFGFLYNVINYEGQLKLSLRYCFTAKGAQSGARDWFHKDPPCKENWYNCDLMEDGISCQLRLCPWSKEPLLPLKDSDWYGCTKVGDQIDCYLKALGDRKIHHHVKHPEVHHDHSPHHEYDGREHGYWDREHDDL